jgi:hypothetical protein
MCPLTFEYLVIYRRDQAMFDTITPSTHFSVITKDIKQSTSYGRALLFI